MAGVMFGTALLAGCTLGPDYHRPAQSLPEQFGQPTPGGAATTPRPAASLGDAGWRSVYPDPALQSLIDAALRNNFDLRIAATRIEEARAALGSARLAQWPAVGVAASVGRTQNSAYQLSPGETERTYDSDQVAATLSLDLDFFGRLRRAKEAARANWLGSEYGRRAVAVALVSDVAGAYFDLLTLDSQLVITRRTVESREKFVELTRAQHDRGVASGLDIATAEAQAALARAEVPDLERQIVQTEDRLSTLLGGFPHAIPRAPATDGLPQVPPLPPTGLPSALLERRPDVRQAEQALIAANAEVGVAKAALFPDITLTGAAGALSVPLAKLFSGPASTWAASAALTQPILSAQTNLYTLQLADARKREALLQYEQTVHTAFQDVADALVAYQRSGEFARELAIQVEALRRAESIALARYRIGYASYFDVITADRDLFPAELQAVQAVRSEVGALVQLYQALGGGWQED